MNICLILNRLSLEVNANDVMIKMTGNILPSISDIMQLTLKTELNAEKTELVLFTYIKVKVKAQGCGAIET